MGFICLQRRERALSPVAVSSAYDGFTFFLIGDPVLLTLPRTSDGLYTYMGSDEPDVSDNDGRIKNNVYDGNTISNTNIGVKIKEADNNSFTSEAYKTQGCVTCEQR